MSQLSNIQQEILRRFQRPRQPMDEKLPDGRSVYDSVRQGPRSETSPQDAGQSASVFAPPLAGRPRTTGVSTGLTNPGNLNPYDRPVLKNADGSISTTSSTGVGTDRGETIIPTVVDGVRLTPEQAMAEFRKTGGNFGSYKTIEQGDIAATALHNDQAAYLAKNGIGTNGNDTRARSVFAPPVAQPSDQTLTPTNQAAITRQRSVFAPPQQSQSSLAAEPPQPSGRNIFSPPANVDSSQAPPAINGESILAPQVNGEPFGARPRRVEPRDYVADDSAYLRDLERVPRNKKDIFIDGLRALNQGFGSNKNVFTPTAREREIAETRQRLGTGLEAAKTQAQIANAGMVPVQTTDGRTIMIPRAKVGDWEIRQRTADQNQQKINAAANKAVYKMDAQGRIIKIIPQAGGPDKVETVSKAVKTKIPHTVWADGKLKIWNSETAQFDDAKDTNDQEITDTIRTPVKVNIAGQTFTISPNTAALATATGERFAITDDRAERGEARTDTKDSQARIAKAAGLVGDITRARTQMADAKAKLAKNPGDTDAEADYDNARTFGLSKAKELNDGYSDLYKAGEGSEGTPFYESIGGSTVGASGQSGGGGTFDMKGWKAEHPNASAAEQRAIRAKAKARNLTVSE